MTARKVKHFTVLNRPPQSGYDASKPGDRPPNIEADGHLTTQQAVNRARAAGLNLLDWAKAEQPWAGLDPSTGQPIPVFLDKLQIMSRFREIRAARKAEEEAQLEEELSLAQEEAQQRALDLEELRARRAGTFAPKEAKEEAEAPGGPQLASG